MIPKYVQDLVSEFGLDSKSTAYLESIHFQIISNPINTSPSPPVPEENILRLSSEIARRYDEPARALMIIDKVIERLFKIKTNNVYSFLGNINPHRDKSKPETKLKIRQLERRVESVFSGEYFLDIAKPGKVPARHFVDNPRSDSQYHGNFYGSHRHD